MRRDLGNLFVQLKEMSRAISREYGRGPCVIARLDKPSACFRAGYAGFCIGRYSECSYEYVMASIKYQKLKKDLEIDEGEENPLKTLEEVVK